MVTYGTVREPGTDKMGGEEFDIPPVEMETCFCPLGCGAKDVRVVENGRDRLQRLPGRFTVVRCTSCGLLRTNPRPSPQGIAFYYPADYAPYSGRKGTRWDRFLERGGKLIEPVVQFNTKRVPHIRPGRMLEIGCAHGKFLQRMAEAGWRCEGVEPCAGAAAVARNRGFTVYTSMLEDMSEQPGVYDLIVAWMVVEHLHDPRGALEKLWHWARPGAYLAISVPNYASKDAQIFGNRWFALDLPRHLFHFTPCTASRLLERAGWSIERILHHRTPGNILGSVGYVLQGHRATRRPGRWLVNTTLRLRFGNYLWFPLSVGLAALGQTGAMTIWARKEH